MDREGRCKHYHSALDIVAIKFKCCNEFYSCIYCHLESENHTPSKWSYSEFHVEAIFCGSCQSKMSISAYLACNYECPNCHSPFNPKCKNHNHFYFE